MAQPLTSTHRWTIVGLLCAGMIIAYIDRISLSAAIADASFQESFALTSTQRGWLSSAFFWTYALLQVPAGWLVDRKGVKYPYASGLFIWSALSAATALAQSLGQLITLRLLLGAGESVVAPASIRWIRMNIAERQRGLAMGIYLAGTKIGPAIGVPIAAMLIESQGWRTMFLVTGVASMAWLIPWLRLVPAQETQPAVTATPRAEAPFWHLLRGTAIWGILIGTFAYSCYLYFCITWLPAYFKEQRHVSTGLMSAYVAFSFSGMALTAIASGWLADRMIARGGDALSVRKRFTIVGMLIAATEVAGAVVTSADAALFFAIFSLAGLGVATANYWALTQTVIPGAAIGRIGGLQNTASNLAGVAAPIMTGRLIEETGSYLAPMQAIAALLVVGAASYALLVKRGGEHDEAAA